ncbi:MAG: hypothetical protein CSB23_03625 [Deltaproteobacteria bacterium]|nr:MAG: hypothetical protein CSB23_03625 [Deltaproteobacteria bacterium]
MKNGQNIPKDMLKKQKLRPKRQRQHLLKIEHFQKKLVYKTKKKQVFDCTKIPRWQVQSTRKTYETLLIQFQNF